MTLQKTLNSFSVASIFIFSISVISLNILAIVFPALLIRLTSNFIHSEINPFEFGFLFEFLIITNLSILFFIIFCKYTIFGKKLTNYIYFLTQIKISEKLTFLCLGIIITVYFIFTFSELEEEELWGDYYSNLLPELEKFSFDTPARFIENILLISSIEIFDNIRVIPFISSILLLFNVFLVTKSISKNNLAAIISVVVMLQSYTFLKYDTYATYTTFWINFYIFSLYLINKKYQFSIIPYIFSILCKVITSFFIPFHIFFIAKSDLRKKTKISLIIIYAVLGFSLLLAATFFFPNHTLFFDEARFWAGFSAFSLELRFDYFLLLFLLPVTVGLLYLTKNKIKHADSILLLISASLLVQSVTNAFGADVLPYRYLPTIVFFSIGIGLIFSKFFSSKELSNSKSVSTHLQE